MFHWSFYDAPRTGINFFAKETFQDVYLSVRAGGSLAYCRLKRRAARSVVKILMASLVLFSINRWFQQWNDLHLQNNVLSKYLWCTVKLYCRESCRQATASCFCLCRFSKRHDKMWNGSVWSKMKSMIKTNGKIFWWKPDYKFFRICCATRVYCNKIIVTLQNAFYIKNFVKLWLVLPYLARSDLVSPYNPSITGPLKQHSTTVLQRKQQ